MPGETPSQPGWYPDENGTMRWFDGASWTDHVQPGSGPATGGPGLPQPGGPTPTQQLPQPPGPPPGGAPYGTVPQPSFPGGPGPGSFPPPPSGGGGRKGLLIALAVIGALVLIAVLAVAAWAVFLRDDDDSGNDDGGDGSSLPDTEPEVVVEEYFEALKADDCAAARELLSVEGRAQDPENCEYPFTTGVDDDTIYSIGEGTVDEEAMTAVVPLQLEGADDPFPVAMSVEDDEWRIDSIDLNNTIDDPTDVPTDVPTDIPTDIPTDFTDVPTDFTDLPTDFSDFPTDFPTDPSELESYLSDYFSEFLTFTG